MMELNMNNLGSHVGRFTLRADAQAVVHKEMQAVTSSAVAKLANDPVNVHILAKHYRMILTEINRLNRTDLYDDTFLQVELLKVHESLCSSVRDEGLSVAYDMMTVPGDTGLYNAHMGKSFSINDDDTSITHRILDAILLIEDKRTPATRVIECSGIGLFERFFLNTETVNQINSMQLGAHLCSSECREALIKAASITRNFNLANAIGFQGVGSSVIEFYESQLLKFGKQVHGADYALKKMDIINKVILDNAINYIIRSMDIATLTRFRKWQPSYSFDLSVTPESIEAMLEGGPEGDKAVHYVFSSAAQVDAFAKAMVSNGETAALLQLIHKNHGLVFNVSPDVVNELSLNLTEALKPDQVYDAKRISIIANAAVYGGPAPDDSIGMAP